MCDSTTVKSIQGRRHCLALQPERQLILSQNGNFPTDVHVLQGIVRGSVAGFRYGSLTMNRKLLKNMTENVAVAAFSHVDYRSGEKWDMARVTKAAHAKGVLSVWDLSHSQGGSG